MDCSYLKPSSRSALVGAVTVVFFAVVDVTVSHAAVPVCGNGIIESGESCDDGNVNDGDGCSATCAVEEACYDEGNTFSFFTWSDSYPGSGDAGVIRVFNDAVDSVKYPGRVIPRFWMAAGDIPFMDYRISRLDEFNDELSNSARGQDYPFVCSASSGRFPYFVALGNHDIDGSASLTPDAQYDYWSNVVGPRLDSTLVGISNFRWGPHNGYDERTTYSFDYKNAHFVIVNQYYGDPMFPTAEPTGCIRSELHRWIDEDLSGTSKPIKFVVGHEPAWSYCSNLAGYGGTSCPLTHEDNQDPAYRPRPHSSTGAWGNPYGRHWGDSLEDKTCPSGSREAFWRLLAGHNVIAHYVGHTHTYSSRLVEGDGTRRNDVSAYGKAGESFDSREGVWEIDNGQTHSSAGAVYVLTTVRENVVTFEAYDQRRGSDGYQEPFHRVETWSVRVGYSPRVAITSPAEGATFAEPAEISITAEAVDADGTVAQVAFYAGPALIGVDSSAPFGVTWGNVAAGSYVLTAVAMDDTGATTASRPVTVTVFSTSGNQPPVLAPIGGKSVAEGTTLSFTASASDPDLPASTLTFSLAGAPTGAGIDATSGAFSWTPSEAQGPGNYAFTVRVTDNGTPALSAAETITVTVGEVNQAPVLAPIGSKSVAEGTTLSFTASASDPDLPANALTFSLTGAPTGAAIDATSGAFSWTPSSGQVGSHTFTVRATDSGSPALSGAEAITVTVRGAPDLVISALSTTATVIAAGERFSLSDTVTNQGSALAGTFEIAFHLSVDPVYGGTNDVAFKRTRSVTSLGVGASSTAATMLRVPATTPPGSYFVCATVDSANTVAEGHEGNNTRCTTGTIWITP